MSGYLISFEGDDGSGKTTALLRTAEQLREKHKLDIVVFREPGGTKIGDKLRSILHDFEYADSITDETELFLYLSSRAQNVAEKVRPALEQNKIVLLDRFFDSTLAYQGFARNVGAHRVFDFNTYATKGLTPDLTVYLDVDPEIGYARTRAGASEGREWNRLDAEHIKFHEKVSYAYQTLYQFDDNQRWEWVNANEDAESVFTNVARIVENRLQMNGFIEGGSGSPERR